MTRPNDNGSEEKALDALATLALLARHGREWTEEDAVRFLREQSSEADLTAAEIDGTGDFAFDAMWARIKNGQNCPPDVEHEAKPAVETMYAAMHRGKGDLPPEALEELERRRQEALEDEEDDHRVGDEGEDTGD
ncbi:MAG: hypothetical protein ACYTKD_04520 [Planctomycetota bacterium]|jgi:hypothetical protein